MAGELLTPNMNLPEPGVGVTAGPQWATDVNSCFTIVDRHDHSPGNGVLIGPSGLNINADLSFNSNNLTLARSIRFAPQLAPLSLPTDLDCIYVSGVDLYYNDGVGNQVRITQSGGVAGSPGSISNLTSPASASYVSADETFVWQSAANTPANMDAGAYIFRNISAGSHGITVQPPLALGSDYTLTLPLLPASTLPVTLTSTGGFGTSQITTAMIAPNAVTASTIANNTITRAQEAAVGQQVSASSGAFNTGSGSPVPVTNLSISITTTGRPVMIMVQPDGTSSISAIGVSSGTPSVVSGALYYIYRDGSPISTTTIIGESFGGNLNLIGAPGQLNFLDTGATAASHTYALYSAQSGGCLAECNYCVLMVYEL